MQIVMTANRNARPKVTISLRIHVWIMPRSMRRSSLCSSPEIEKLPRRPRFVRCGSKLAHMLIVHRVFLDHPLNQSNIIIRQFYDKRDVYDVGTGY